MRFSTILLLSLVASVLMLRTCHGAARIVRRQADDDNETSLETESGKDSNEFGFEESDSKEDGNDSKGDDDNSKEDKDPVDDDDDDRRDGKDDDEDGRSIFTMPSYFSNVMRRMREMMHQLTHTMTRHAEGGMVHGRIPNFFRDLGKDLPTVVNETSSDVIDINGRKYKMVKTLTEKAGNGTVLVVSSINYVPVKDDDTKEAKEDETKVVKDEVEVDQI